MIWNIPTSIWKILRTHWQVLSKDARNLVEENANICGVEVNLEWQAKSTIDYMCNTCDEERGWKGEKMVEKHLNGEETLLQSLYKSTRGIV